MILVDTSVWIDHLRKTNEALAALLEAGAVLAHPFVIAELALGHLRQREIVLTAMSGLPRAAVASETEALRFVERHRLFGCGIGYVDAHLLAATRLTGNTSFWTNDRRLHGVAKALGAAAAPPFDLAARA